MHMCSNHPTSYSDEHNVIPQTATKNPQVVINDMQGRYLPLSKLVLGAAQTTIKGNDGVWAFDVSMGFSSVLTFSNPNIS